MIASFPPIVIQRLQNLPEPQIRAYAKMHCQIRIPRNQIGTFEIRARFPALRQDDAIDFHLFESLSNKYNSGQLFVFKGENEFVFRPEDDGFFERTGDGIPMMPDMIAIFSQDENITSVYIEIHPVVPVGGDAHFLNPYTMD